MLVIVTSHCQAPPMRPMKILEEVQEIALSKQDYRASEGFRVQPNNDCTLTFAYIGPLKTKSLILTLATAADQVIYDGIECLMAAAQATTSRNNFPRVTVASRHAPNPTYS